MNKEGRPINMGNVDIFLPRALLKKMESEKKCIVWDPMGVEFFREKIDDNVSPGEYIRQVGQEVEKLEENGVEMLNNFFLGGKSYLNDLSDTGEIPMPYTEFPILKRGEMAVEKTKKMIENLEIRSDNLPSLIVRKPNGLFGTPSHGGRGVEVLDPRKTNFEWNNPDLIFQEFVYPPLSIFKDGYLRDFRVIVIGGEAKTWYARRAKDRLINPQTGELDENPPSHSRFLSNLCQEGKYEEPPKELKKISFQFAEKVHKMMTIWGNTFREMMWQIKGEAKCRFMSVDLLFDQKCNPKLLEVDFFPDMRRFPKSEVLAEKTSSYLKKLSGQTGKKIFINNFFGDYDLLHQVTNKLKKQNINCEQMVCWN